VPSAKPEPSAEHQAKDKEKDKEKEREAHKKPLASLILTVKLALLADPRLSHYEIEVGENDQTITLEGRVAGEEDKSAAAEVARSVPGVKTVVNKLEVDKGLAQALSKKQDEVITGLVKERFAKSATLKSANFEVKTEEGVVSISGAVRFQVIALEAAEAARQVPGVKAVKTDKVRLEGES
jgi:hyperosmotically inducible protein